MVTWAVLGVLLLLSVASGVRVAQEFVAAAERRQVRARPARRSQLPFGVVLLLIIGAALLLHPVIAQVVRNLPSTVLYAVNVVFLGLGAGMFLGLFAPLRAMYQRMRSTRRDGQ